MKLCWLYLLVFMLTACGGESNPDKIKIEESVLQKTNIPRVINMNYKKLLQGKPSESALEAMNRYEKLLQVLLATVEGFEDSLSLYVIDYTKEDKLIVDKNIKSTEERFNIILPESYKAFMIEKGAFSFGEDNLDNYLYTPYLSSLADKIINTEYYVDKEAIKKDYGENGLKRMEQLICFEKSDDYAFLCFDITSYDIKTKEMDIYFNDQDDWLGDRVNQPSFDKYIVTEVNEKIEQIIDDMELNN